MSKQKTNLWFKAKTYGWGWTPSTWEGWLLVIVYLIQVISISFVAEELFQSMKGTIIFFMVVISSIISLLLISYKTGEKPRWRWGKDT